MACRQLGQLDAPVDPEGAGPDEEGVGSLVHKRRERGIDLMDGAGVENLDLQPNGASGRSHVSQGSLGIRDIGRIDKHCNARSPWHELMQEFQPLCLQLGSEQIDSASAN